jgi:hypothetical protein
LGSGLGGTSRDEFFSVAADYILRHTRYQRADRFDPLGQLFEELAAWCQGEIVRDEKQTGHRKRHIKVRVHNPKHPRQSKAFVGDWILYTDKGYKVYTNMAFRQSFDETETPDAAGVVTPPVPIENIEEPLKAELRDAHSAAQTREMLENKPDVEAEIRREMLTQNPLSPEMQQAVETIEAEGGTVEAATPQGIADAVRENEQERVIDATEGKRVLSVQEQAQMDPQEIRELIQTGEVVLAQDLVA